VSSAGGLLLAEPVIDRAIRHATIRHGLITQQSCLGLEERRTVYSMLGLCVEALLDRSIRVCGAFGEESLVWQNDRTSTR
jgi:hypothetical protein